MTEDRDLTDLLRGAVPDDVPAPADGAGRAVRSARRRAGAAVAGAAGLVAVLALGVPAALSSQGLEAAPRPAASPSDPPAPVASPAPSADPEPVGSVAASAPPSAPPSPVETPDEVPSATSEPEPSTEEPGPVPVLQVEGTEDGPATAGELAGHSPVEGDLGYVAYGGPASWGTAWCSDDAPWTDAARTGWSAQEFFGGDSGVTVHVASYRDETAAAQALEEVHARAAACSAGPLPYGAEGNTSTSWLDLGRSDRAGGADATGAAWMYTAPDPVTGEVVDDLTPGQVVSLVRQGRVLAMAVYLDEYSLGAAVGAVAGDTRPGAGRVAEGEDPRERLDERVASTRALAEVVAASAVSALD